MDNLSTIIIILFGTPLVIGVLGLVKPKLSIHDNVMHIISIGFNLMMVIIALYLSVKIFLQNFLDLQGNLWVFAKLGKIEFNFGYLLDKLNLIMLNIVMGLSLIIQIYNVKFISKKFIIKYYSYFNLIIFSMLLIVLSNNFFQLFCGWKLVGFFYYSLINSDPDNSSSKPLEFKFWLFNNLADLSLLLAIASIWNNYYSLDYMYILNNLTLAPGTCPCMIFGIISAVIAKSALFPLHIWLPTFTQKVSLSLGVLLHSGIILITGIFLLLRIYPFLELNCYWLNMLLGIGGLTTILASSIACVAMDTKKILAYSTISQLGMLLIAIGSSSVAIILSYSINHLIIKSLLFFSLGAIFLTTKQEYNKIIDFPSNIRKHCLISYIGVLLSCLSLANLPVSGYFFSNNIVFSKVAGSNFAYANQLYYILLINNILTSFHAFRMFFLIFYPCTNQTIIRKIKKLPTSIYGTIIFLIILLLLTNLSLEKSIFKQILLWNFNLPNLCSYIGILIAFLMYIKRLDFFVKLVLKLKANFLFLFKMLEQDYFLNDIYDLLSVSLNKLADFGVCFFDRKIMQQKSRYSINNFLNKSIELIEKLHIDNFNIYIFIHFCGIVLILLCFIAIKF